MKKTSFSKTLSIAIILMLLSISISNLGFAANADTQSATPRCGVAWPNGSLIDPYATPPKVTLPNGTVLDIAQSPVDCHLYGSFDSTDRGPDPTGNIGEDFVQSTNNPTVSSILPNQSYCLGVTTCSAIGTVSASDTIVIVAQVPAGTVTISDSSLNLAWTTAVSYNGGTSMQGVIFYARTSASQSGSDTFKVKTSGSAGTMALEGFDVHDLGTGYTIVPKTNVCTSGCSSSISTPSVNFAPSPSFEVDSLFASPGYGTTCGGSVPSGWSLACGTDNPFTGAGYSTSQSISTTFPATDGRSNPSAWVDVGAVFETPYFTTVSTNWNVLNAPSVSLTCSFNINPNLDCQNDVFWNGVQLNQGAGSSGIVVQPLLAYGCAVWDSLGNCQVPGSSYNYWYVLAWIQNVNCGQGTNACFGAVGSVQVGDSISGTITRYADSSCSTKFAYSVLIQDNTHYTNSAIAVCLQPYQLSTWADGGVLEIHNLNACNQLPNAYSEQFSSFSQTNTGGADLNYVGTTNGYTFCGVSATWAGIPPYQEPIISWTP